MLEGGGGGGGGGGKAKVKLRWTSKQSGGEQYCYLESKETYIELTRCIITLK